MQLGVKSAIFRVCRSFVIVTKHPKIADFITQIIHKVLLQTLPFLSSSASSKPP